MATCCTNNIIIPTTCESCKEIIDACCVMHEGSLPCLFPDIDASGGVTGKGNAGSYTLTINTASALGIEVGDVLTNESSQDQLVTDGAMVVSVTKLSSVLYSVTLNKPNLTSTDNYTKLIRTRYTDASISQCRINQAINDYICRASGNSCCETWNPITDFNASGEFTWSDASAESELQGGEYLTPSSCNCNTVKLRGTVMGPWLGPVFAMFTLPSGIEPLKGRTYSVTVTAVNSISPITTQDIFPGTIVINGSTVFLRIKNYCCETELDFNPSRVTLYVSLEGISFETDV